MIKRILLVGSMLCMCFSVEARAELSYEGSDLIGRKLLPSLTKAFSSKTGKRFGAILSDSSAAGLRKLVQGGFQIAGSSRRLTPEEKRQMFFYQIIAYDAIIVCVHEENFLSNLSKEQLKAIFTGQLTNWSQVGGKDMPITCIIQSEKESRGTMIEFRSLAMDGAAYSVFSKEAATPEEQVAALAQDPGGITVLSKVFLKAGIKAVAVDGVFPGIEATARGIYLLSRPLILVTRELPEADVKEFIDFVISEEGQRLIAADFVPVRHEWPTRD